MTRAIHPSKKKRLQKRASQTRWAPIWTVAKIYGKTRKVHPGRHTVKKRNWRRSKMQL